MNNHLPPLIFGRGTGFIASLLLMFLMFAAGCGGSKTASNPAPTPVPSPTTTPSPATAFAQIRIGDAPDDSIVNFKFSIGSPVILTMAGATGAVSISVGPNHFEMTHLAAKMEPLLLLSNAPQGSFVSAQITIQNPDLTFLTPGGTPVRISGQDQTVIIPLNPPLSIDSTLVVVNLDVNVANSIVSTTAGTITGVNFSPSSFSLSSKAIAAEAEQQDDSGEMEGVVGQVTGVLDPVFVLNPTSNSELTLGTDSNTQFTGGLTNLDSAINHLVRVDGVSRADGLMVARKMEDLEGESGSELDGILTQVSGNPATLLSLLTQDGIGNGMDPAKVGATFTIDVSGLPANRFKVDLGKCDASGLAVPSANFPFDATTIHAGQRIEADNAAGVPPANGRFTADRVWLEQQAIKGTVSNYVTTMGTATTFDLALPSDSSLTIMSGQTTVHVFQQPGTDDRVGTIGNKSVVRVRGLLFWTGTGFNMIARRITAP